MIQFLNPLVLLGLAAAAIPFIIHFLNRFRAERRDFSSLMLLNEVSSRNVRRLRMRRWLLLVLRTLAVVLLVLVPSRPVVRGVFSSGPSDHLPTSVVFIFDNSASMGYVDSRGAVSDRLAGSLEQVRGWLNPQDRCLLITASDDYRVQGRGWGGAQDLPTAGGILSPGYRGTNLGPSVEAAAALLESERETSAREVYIFSDRQRGFLGTDSLRLPPAGRIRWYIVDAHSPGPENMALTGLSLPGEIIRPGAPLRVGLEVSHFGGARNEKAMPRLYLDERLVGQGEVAVEPGSRATVSLELPPIEAGAYELSAVLDADNLDVDNRRSILLNVPPRLRVTLVEAPGAGSPYLRVALEVLGEQGARAISANLVPRLPTSPADFSGTDVFILHGLDFPEDGLRLFLDRAMNLGSGVLILPSRSDAVNARFSAVAERLGIPFRLEPARALGPGAFDVPRPPGPSDEAEALFGPLFEALPGLEQARLHTLRGLSPAGGPDGPTKLYAWDLTSAAGGTFLRLVRGAGFSLALSTTDLASIGETEIPGTPLFVPLLHSLLSLAAERGPLVNRSLIVGETASIFFGAPVSTAQMEIHGPGQGRYLLPPGEQARVDFEHAFRPGVYRIYDSGRLIGAFGVTTDPGESDVRLEDPEVVRERLAGQEVVFVSPEDALADRVFLDRGGVEVWPGLLALLLLVLGIEQVVANRKEDEEKKK